MITGEHQQERIFGQVSLAAPASGLDQKADARVIQCHCVRLAIELDCHFDATGQANQDLPLLAMRMTSPNGIDRHVFDDKNPARCKRQVIEIDGHEGTALILDGR